MPGYNKSPYAFDDLREIFERAMLSEHGIKIVCKSRSEAIITRSRMNYLRKMDRKENAITYQSDHPMHMRSVWDRLVLRVPAKGAPDETTIYMEKRSHENFIIEDLSGPQFEPLEEAGRKNV